MVDLLLLLCWLCLVLFYLLIGFALLSLAKDRWEDFFLVFISLKDSTTRSSQDWRFKLILKVIVNVRVLVSSEYRWLNLNFLSKSYLFLFK